MYHLKSGQIFIHCVFMKKAQCLIILLLLLYSNNIRTQNIRFYGLKDQGTGEISSNLINQICQDSYGFIWITTDYGLNKFDGNHFIQYLHDEKDNSSLLSNNTNSLMLDKDNTLWVGFNNGLQYYQSDENSFKTISFPENISPHISDIIELQDGQIWVTTSGWGVYSINKEKRTATLLDDITNLTGDFLGYIYEDKNHCIWISIDNNGVIKINPSAKTSERFKTPDIPYNNVNNIVEDKNGRLYVSLSKAICFLDESTGKFVPISSGDGEDVSFRTMILSSKGTIYIATEGHGLRYIDNVSNKLKPATNRSGSFNYDTAKIYALAEDRDQNLWLGCFQKGILMIPSESTEFNYWGFVDKEYQLGNTITSIIKDHQNKVWCGIDKEGIFKLSSKGKKEKHFAEVKDITRMIEDSDNTLWVTSYNKGLAKINPQTGQYHFENIPFQGYMKTLTEGLDKHLYISTFGFGFIRYNLKTREWVQYNMKQEDPVKGNLGNDWINTIICDSDGLIWFGHYKGVSCFDPQQERFLTIESEVLPKQICISLAEGKDNNIWIGTYNGLYCFNKKTKQIKNYTVNDGLSSNVICGIAQDNNGNIWCSTFKGINQLRIEDNKIINFYIGNGLVDKIYNRGIYFKAKDNMIYFGGSGGITSFSPQNISITNYKHEILTTNVYVHNQSVNTNSLSGGERIISTNILDAKDFKFSYEDNTFTFEFSTIDFKDPENIYYEYRLKDLSDDWNSTLPGINRITYNHLNPGKYTLEVRAGKYGSYTPIKQLSLTISPPWFKSTWAYILYLCLFVAIGILVINLIRRKRNERISESKLQFFINISHEIRSPLTLIISPMEKLMKGNFDAPTMKTLQNMHRNANRILGLVNQLLDIRKLDKGQMRLKFSETDMVGFIKELYDVFEYQSTKRDINFIFDHPMDKLAVWVDRNNFDKILMNLLSNAFKYTPDGGEIIILLRTGIDNENRGVLENFMEICILDTGIGLDKGKIDKIFDRFYQGQNQETFTTVGSGIGLNLARTLIQLHHGSITAFNRTDTKGSCFTIRIPLGNEHLNKDEIAEYGSTVRPILQQASTPVDVQDETKKIKRKTNYKILVIDDEKEIRDYLKEELGETYKILEAENGAEGLKMALSQQPHLIISDVVMPHMDGFTFVKKLKTNNNISHIPVILLTSKTEYKDRIEALDKGADSYLTKPFNIEEVIITVNNLITSRQTLKGKFSGVQDQEDKVKPINFKSSDEVLMERIMAVINDNISNPELNVELLVSKIGLSRVQLHRKLKELTGISTGDFIRNIKLKQAAALLREKKMNISQVAYSVGFTNQTHFSTIFKKFYGVSPSDYIIQINEENIPDTE